MHNMICLQVMTTFMTMKCFLSNQIKAVFGRVIFACNPTKTIIIILLKFAEYDTIITNSVPGK